MAKLNTQFICINLNLIFGRDLFFFSKPVLLVLEDDETNLLRCLLDSKELFGDYSYIKGVQLKAGICKIILNDQ